MEYIRLCTFRIAHFLGAVNHSIMNIVCSVCMCISVKIIKESKDSTPGRNKNKVEK